MSLSRSFYVAALIAGIAGSAFGQIVTRSLFYGDALQRSEITSVSVEKRYSTSEQATEELENKIAYAIEDELSLSGFLPALRTRPAGLIVSFYIEATRNQDDTRTEDSMKEGSLVIECRDADDERLVWHGVAEAVTGMSASDPYLWQGKLTEAARMLVRRFNEEGMTN